MRTQALSGILLLGIFENYEKAEMIIRTETPADLTAIRALSARAFAPMPYSDGSEPRIIDALREAGELTLSLVAEQDNKLLGQITFSPVSIDGAHDQWFGLGPVAVEPERQSTGIGGALIREGLDRLKTMEAKGCVLVGNPDYYSRFGFKNHCGLTYADLDTAYIQKLVLAGPDRTGTLTYCDSFERAAAGK